MASSLIPPPGNHGFPSRKARHRRPGYAFGYIFKVQNFLQGILHRPMDGLLPSGGVEAANGWFLFWWIICPVDGASDIRDQLTSWGKGSFELLIHRVDDTSQLNSRISEPSTVWSLRGHIQLLPRYGSFKSHLEIIPWETLSIVNTSIVTGASANPPGVPCGPSVAQAPKAPPKDAQLTAAACWSYQGRWEIHLSSFVDVVVLTSDHTHRIHVWYIYLHLIDFMVNVGKYTIRGSYGVEPTWLYLNDIQRWNDLFVTCDPSMRGKSDVTSCVIYRHFLFCTSVCAEFWLFQSGCL